MIDSTSETLLTLAQAAAEIPRRRRGRKAHVSTIYRWATTGIRGVVLESLQVGGCRCTSREALQRFFEALSAPRSHPTGLATPGAGVAPRSRLRRLRASAAAGETLRRLGA